MNSQCFTGSRWRSERSRFGDSKDIWTVQLKLKATQKEAVRLADLALKASCLPITGRCRFSAQQVRAYFVMLFILIIYTLRGFFMGKSLECRQASLECGLLPQRHGNIIGAQCGLALSCLNRYGIPYDYILGMHQYHIFLN